MKRRRICEFCGKPFAATRPDARFCTTAHKSKNHRKSRSVPVRIVAVKNALSSLVEDAADESQEWWAGALDDLLDHVRTEAERITDERKTP